MLDRLIRSLKYFQIFFYLAILFLWFKDNFPLFKRVSVSIFFALIPFIIITVVRILLRLRQKKIKFRIKFNKKIFALIALLLIATAIRIPFLLYNFGLVDSDDVLFTLISKHISEGKMPPVYYYGLQYEGTFGSHIYALLFKIFGYSILIALLVSFIFYLAFIIIQFIFFKDIFSSFNLSLILCLFYCLPIGHLLAVSSRLDYQPVVLFLGALSVYFSFLIYKKNKENVIPLLGFCLGLSFWIHPLSIYFAISAFIFVVLKFKLMLRKYFQLIIYGLIGSFPAVLNEIGQGFQTFKYLSSGAKVQGVPVDKIKAIVANVIYLISGEKNFINYIYIILILAGIIRIIYLSFKKKKFLVENIFVLFFISVLIVYAFSKIKVDEWLLRYLYPLYFVLPFFLISVFNLLRKKIKYILILVLFLIIVIFSNIKGTYANYLSVKKAHHNLKEIINTIELTGEKYWVGDFWQAYLITGLSGEEIVCWSHPQEYYFPYKLRYFNHGENNNYVFFKEEGSYAVKYKERLHLVVEQLGAYFNRANELIDLLDRLNIKAKKKNIGDSCWLIYDIAGQVFPWTIKAPLPQQIPELELIKIESLRGHLLLTFKNRIISDFSGFKLHIEIPGYSSLARGFSLDKEMIKSRIPFPRSEILEIKYYLDYKGLKIPSTLQETFYSPQGKERQEGRKKIINLSGFGPETEVYGKKMRVCEKEVKFEINKAIGKKLKIHLYLYSPFQFSHPFWHGEYFQEVKIDINNLYFTERRLADGKNVIDLEIEGSHLKKRTNIITLKFKYHLPFGFAPVWKTSALLEKIEVE